MEMGVGHLSRSVTNESAENPNEKMVLDFLGEILGISPFSLEAHFRKPIFLFFHKYVDLVNPYSK